jgi:hypothetical protein
MKLYFICTSADVMTCCDIWGSKLSVGNTLSGLINVAMTKRLEQSPCEANFFLSDRDAPCFYGT